MRVQEVAWQAIALVAVFAAGIYMGARHTPHVYRLAPSACVLEMEK